MTSRALTSHVGSIHPIALLYEIPTEGFEMNSNGIHWIYTADIAVDEENLHTAIPASVWTVTITVNQTNGVASVRIEPNVGTTELTSREPLRVEGAISGTPGCGFGEKFETTIGPEGWNSQEKSRTVSVPVESDYYALCHTNHYRMQQRAIIYITLAFYIKNHSGRMSKYQASIAHNLGKLLESSRVADCTLVTRDGNKFQAHRAILAAQSPIFAAMFEHEMKEKLSGLCEIDDLDGDVLEILLKFAYTGASFEAAERLQEIYEAADKYDMADLREHCVDLMGENINVENAVPCLWFAKERGLTQLKIKIATFIGENGSEI